MREMLRPMAAAALALALIGTWGALLPTTAQMVTKEVQLTEKHVEGFIAAQKKMAAAKEAEFEAIAKAHGFANLDEIDTVEVNIMMVMEGLDPQTKAFAEPPVQIRKLIEEVNKDSSMPEDQRKQALAKLNEELKTARPLRFPGNIELVKRYYDRIIAVLQP
ncbi:MAG: hypothetical protein ACRET6_10965 [Burkholderiales bacterium]